MIIGTDEAYRDLAPQHAVAPQGIQQNQRYKNQRCPEHNIQREMTRGRVPNG